MKKLDELRKHLRAGHVYRREDLARLSSAVDRHIKQLVESGDLTKLSPGLYTHPRKTVFGEAPPDDTTLVSAFLKDDDFLITSANSFNALGVGTTQLYNETVVYNNKRHGHFTLGGRNFDFRRKPGFPKKASREFLFVDLMNNLDRLAEDKQKLLARVEEKSKSLNKSALMTVARRFGTVRTRKFFDNVMTHTAHAS
jgi:hypothetical protein